MNEEQFNEYLELLKAYKGQFPDDESPEAMHSRLGIDEAYKQLKANQGRRLVVEVDPELIDGERFTWVNP